MAELDIWLFEWSRTQLMAVGWALLAGLVMTLFAWKARRAYLQLPELPVHPDSPITDHIHVVVPARNEAKNLPGLLRSFPPEQVTVVDDNSTDDTESVARAAGVQVVKAPPLPKGWKGKPHACRTGAEAAPRKELLLFVDADTTYKPEFLPSVVDAAQDRGLGILSAFLRQEFASLPERMILPFAQGIYFCGFNAVEINDGAQPTALANGQCLLFRRSAYDFISGHNAVRNSVVEDIELARVAKKHRLPLRVYRAEHLGAVRMYEGLTGIWQGLTKTAFRFLVVNPLSGFLVALASVMMLAWLPLSVHLWRVGCLASACAMAALPVILFKPWYGSWRHAPLVWPGMFFYQVIAFNALAVATFGKQTMWKGRLV